MLSFGSWHRGCSSALTPAIALLQLQQAQQGNSSCFGAVHASAQRSADTRSSNSATSETARSSACSFWSAPLSQQQHSNLNCNPQFTELLHTAVQQQAAMSAINHMQLPISMHLSHNLNLQRQSAVASAIGKPPWYTCTGQCILQWKHSVA